MLSALRSTARSVSKNHMAFFSTVPKEQRVQVGDWNINYIKVGHGAHHVLLVPGILGTIWTDMKPQVEGFDRDQFTVIALDPPGYGKSRPPEKEFNSNMYNKEAEITYEFLKTLGIQKCSLLGWSAGAAVSCILAANHPEAVDKLVMCGVASFILPQEMKIMKVRRNTNTWSVKMKEPMVEVYGEEKFANYWAQWTDAMTEMYENTKGNIYSDRLKDVRCSTFILHGEQDPVFNCSHATYIHKHIKESRLHIYPEGKHNIHLRYVEDFNKRVQEFLLQPS